MITIERTEHVLTRCYFLSSNRIADSQHIVVVSFIIEARWRAATNNHFHYQLIWQSFSRFIKFITAFFTHVFACPLPCMFPFHSTTDSNNQPIVILCWSQLINHQFGSEFGVRWDKETPKHGGQGSLRNMIQTYLSIKSHTSWPTTCSS